eukprot:TRINITY_DN7051_c0_g1_i11.p1 TRINITY_DN7051_c0_g1~~TRINITY_DN7051_c0_g1_i11.p1  ORF type:complete len:448 (+),score=83.86 TRINITY_DN7051_c0_g1_i11:449-1792(+)
MSGNALKDPKLLNRFSMLTFADLKKYHFYYWFFFPVLTGEGLTTIEQSSPLSELWDHVQVSSLTSEIQKSWNKNLPFFIIVREPDGVIIKDICSFTETSYRLGTTEEIYFGIMDPANSDNIPGWPVRNFLTLLNVAFKLSHVKIVTVKYSRCDSTKILAQFFSLKLSDFSMFNENNIPSAVGIEKNHQGKLQPKFVNLASAMDPKQLMENAVDLNLKLMRWRVLPSLNLELVARTKCLIIGAGTLGCNIARSLMSWGVRTLTFVDSGKVSFSNPVRQTLYTFEDAKNSKMKATAAAEACRAIFPSIVASGHIMMVPMPGHPVEEKNEEEMRRVMCDLSELIAAHDVVFLALDSREARWLPTLLGTFYGKIVINTALGFDTYVVMRHGTRGQSPRLGCYFCNDVVAPRDSLTDRTLDQQCTVTRPGLSFLAASQAVELMVSLVHHPLR